MMVDLIKIFSVFYSNTVPSSNVIMNIYIVIKEKISFLDFSVGFYMSRLIIETELLTVMLFPSCSQNCGCRQIVKVFIYLFCRF